MRTFKNMTNQNWNVTNFLLHIILIILLVVILFVNVVYFDSVRTYHRNRRNNTRVNIFYPLTESQANIGFWINLILLIIVVIALILYFILSFYGMPFFNCVSTSDEIKTDVVNVSSQPASINHTSQPVSIQYTSQPAPVQYTSQSVPINYTPFAPYNTVTPKNYTYA